MVVLVGYASEHGSTHGIAEHIAAVLRERGHEVVLGQLDGNLHADGYDAYVLGSAVHGGAWLEGAIEFADTHRGTLAGRPVWIFSVGLARVVGGWFERHAPEAKGLVAVQEMVRPRDHFLFAGALERDHLPPLGRLIYRAMGGRYGDFRNWEEIETRARSIARQLTERDRRRGGAADAPW